METKATTLGRIANVEAQIKELTKQRNELRERAILNGWAMWEFSCDGLKTNKAPDMKWWKEHRGSSFNRLCENSSDAKHPDHKQFWKKPSKLLVIRMLCIR